MRGALIAGLLCAAAPAAGQTLQADYDAAEAALAAGDNATAVTRFEAVLARMTKAAANPANRNAALIRAKLAGALMHSGRLDEAAAAYRAALPGFQRETADDRRERALALNGLGHTEEQRLDFEAAREAYGKAAAVGAFVEDSLQALDAQFGLARTSLFSNPDEARRILDASAPRAAIAYGKRADMLAEVYTMRGRVELNDGKPTAALEWFQKALKTAGGLAGQRVSVGDIRIRSDLALAYSLLHDDENVRRYLA